jgi:hypothetical protein
MTSAFPSDLKPATDTGKPGGGLVDTGNSSFLTDFDKTGPGTIDTDEVDPVARPRSTSPMAATRRPRRSSRRRCRATSRAPKFR